MKASWVTAVLMLAWAVVAQGEVAPEDLILLAGRTREDEVAAGRA